MSDYSTVRDAIKTGLALVSNIGVVQPRERYAADWSTYLDLFKTTIAGKDQIRGWFITRPEVRSREDTFTRVERAHQFVIHGMLGLQDSADTDSTFGDLVDSVMDKLDGLTFAGFWQVEPSVLRVLQLRQFGSVLCHYCEIYLVVRKSA